MLFTGYQDLLRLKSLPFLKVLGWGQISDGLFLMMKDSIEIRLHSRNFGKDRSFNLGWRQDLDRET
jgi:hypothetical protein